MEFLDRVHVSEMKLQEKGLWDVPHPWLNLLIPKSRIHDFAQEVFGKILTDTSHGPILIYPVNKSKYGNHYHSNNLLTGCMRLPNMMYDHFVLQVDKRNINGYT